ncbi:aminodeoxychorismate synthase component I [Zhouia amylolytica]|uniref:aminodeoxychorismate synthase component I n=1 Tax=Zhouia amylolytica TaxID=376730 RepID=UPI0020CD8FBA|nr:aminodeoxychorismate synthase component I [Zhouia amylolytica]MCQ0112124.1 aminodeoxychorismate synthase component I [Zhouia amylolytica]
MYRKTVVFEPKDIEIFKDKLLSWSQQFEEVTWLDSNNYNRRYSSFDSILAFDALTSIQTDAFDAFDKLKEYQSVTHDWLFGYLTYDLKNDVERLESNNYDGLEFPDLYFFQPKKIITIKGTKVEFHYLPMVDDEVEEDFNLITNFSTDDPNRANEQNAIKIKLRIHKDEYLHKVQKMLDHIHRGDIYEANFCQEFYAENTELAPLKSYRHLNEISKPPFATFLKIRDKYLMSASPERYLRKEGLHILSQPIKGTAKRAPFLKADVQLVNSLRNNPKERSENIMIVDLVRNDLSRVAVKGSVKVEELCKVYTFEQVHQLISTVKATVTDDMNPIDIIKASFPMGSMTGAPKISAMKIIEELEETKRGLYSGAVGYFTPVGDFDFNVVIRSILYNAGKKYISFSVGGAITAESIPENEYEECLIKAKAMREVLEGKDKGEKV